MPSDRSVTEQVFQFAHELGPASEKRLHDPENGALDDVLERVQRGADVEDSVLGHMHSALAGNRKVADEFTAYFLLEMKRSGRAPHLLTAQLRRYLDTQDLVISVFGDLGGDLATLEFTSRHQFRSLLSKRLEWKATDKARHLRAHTRREDRRVPLQPEELELDTGGNEESLPVRQSIENEEMQRLALVLLRLKDRDRELLTLHLKGESLESIADAHDLSYEAARKALARAKEQARKLLRGGERRPDLESCT